MKKLMVMGMFYDLKPVLDDFIKYVELASSVTKPSQQGNWCDPFVDSKMKVSEK